MKFGNQDGKGFGFGSFGAGQTQAPPPDEVEPEETTAETTAQAKRAHRRTKECTELSQRYEYRRAFSEVKLLEAMQYVKLQDHTTYNFITAGDLDSLSYLKVVLNQHDWTTVYYRHGAWRQRIFCRYGNGTNKGASENLICIWARYSRAAIRLSGRW